MDPISVELRLELDMFKGEVDKAVAYVKDKLGNANVTGVGAGKQAGDADKIASTVRKANQAAAGAPSGALSGLNPQLMGATTTLGRESTKAELAARRAAAKTLKDRATFMSDMSFLMMPLMNPGSLWGTLFATRQTFSAMTKTEKGRGMTGGSLGVAGLMTTGLLVGAMALGTAFKGLQAIVAGVTSSFRTAGKEYAGALKSGGLPLSFTVRRGNLASIIGVSEKEVFFYGRQIQFLTERISLANGVIAKTSTPLTQVSWEFKILQTNMKALWAQVGNEVAPAILALTRLFNNLAEAAIKAAPATDSAIRGFLVGAGAFKTLGLYESMMDAGSRLMQKERMPPPMTYMRRLDVGAWERMGLVVGNMSARSPAEETAKNTRKTVEVLQGMRQSMIPRSGMDFFNPAVSNP